MKQKELESEIGKLVEDKKRLEANTSRYNLISRILAGELEENPHLNAFKQLLENDFLKFANTEASLANEAEMTITMQAVRDQFERVANFPVTHRKRVVAIGGGFSSGKSTFLKQIFENKVDLPIRMEPATAIPTYVLPGSSVNIKGINHRGGKFELSDLYEKLSHDFIKSFPFRLREMLDAVIIQSPLRSTNFDHICFLDTPGYDSGDRSSSLMTDKKIATEQLRNADALIWMVGLDVNGTIPSSDLKFLKGIGNKDLYIILSKAELKSSKDIEDILDEVTDCLEDYDINNYYGISAYSAHTGQEYFCRKKHLGDFFTETNKQVDTKKNLQTKINKVFEAYDTAIKNDLEKVQKFHSAINSFKLDILENSGSDDFYNSFKRDMLENGGSDDLYDQFSERIESLEYPRSVAKLRGDIERLGKLQADMNKVLEEFFDNL